VLFRNTVAQTAVLVTAYVFSFVLAPVMLARLGLAQFGVWAVTGAFATYAGGMDLGITRSLSRFVALYHAKEDRRAVDELFTLGLLAVGTVWLIASTAAIVAAPLAAGALDDVLTTGEMRVVLLSSVAISATNAWRNVMRAVPQGMENFVPPNVAEMAFNTLNFVLSVVALVVSSELAVYAAANVAAGVVGLAFGLVALRHVIGRLRVRLPSRALVREVLGYSLKSQLMWLSDVSVTQSAKVILAVVVDVRLAGAYEIAGRVVVAAKAVSVLSISAMVPTATARIAREGKGIIGDFYRRYTTRAVSVSLPFLAFLCVSSPALLVAWLGEVPDGSVMVFVVLTVANIFNLTIGVGWILDLALGRVGRQAWMSVLVAVISITSMVLLAPSLELVGVAGSVAFGNVCGVLYFLWRFHRAHGDQGLPLRAYVRAAGPPALLAVLAGVPVALAWLVVETPDGRGAAALLSLACLAVYVGIYWPLASRLGYLPEKLRPAGLVGVLRARRSREARPLEAA